MPCRSSSFLWMCSGSTGRVGPVAKPGCPDGPRRTALAMTSREEDGATLRLLETTGRSQERPRRSVRRTLRQPKRGRAAVGEVLGVPFFWHARTAKELITALLRQDTCFTRVRQLYNAQRACTGVKDAQAQIAHLNANLTGTIRFPGPCANCGRSVMVGCMKREVRSQQSLQGKRVWGAGVADTGRSTFRTVSVRAILLFLNHTRAACVSKRQQRWQTRAPSNAS